MAVAGGMTMNVLSVGIGQHLHRSVDGGATWTQALREIPGRRVPFVRGRVDLSRLPVRPRDTIWDFVTLLPDGFGVAVNHEATVPNPKEPDAPKGLAHVFRTRDGGQSWQELQVTVNWKLTQVVRRLMTTTTVEEYHSLVLVKPDCIVLAWEDPWIHDGAESHVIHSRDGGESWRYGSLGQANPILAADDSGRLFAQDDRHILESVDGGATWTRREFRIEWPPGLPPDHPRPLRHVVFGEEGVAWALVVQWRRGLSFDPVHVALLRTTDHGAHWGAVQVFDGPETGDVNERHMLTLDVE